MPGIEPRPQRWEARVLPLCHRGPLKLQVILLIMKGTGITETSYYSLSYWDRHKLTHYVEALEKVGE